MKQTTVAHELLCNITISLTEWFFHVPYPIFLAQPLFYVSVSKRAASTIFTPLVWHGSRVRTRHLLLRKLTLYQANEAVKIFIVNPEKPSDLDLQ